MTVIEQWAEDTAKAICAEPTELRVKVFLLQARAQESRHMASELTLQFGVNELSAFMLDRSRKLEAIAMEMAKKMTIQVVQ